MKRFGIKNTDYPHGIGYFSCKKCHKIVDGVNHYGVCLECVKQEIANIE